MTARETLAQEWRDKLEDFAYSEMTVQQWCDFNRVSIYQYYYWRRRLARLDAQIPQKTAWMPLEIVDSPTISTAPGGVTIRIAGGAIEVTAGFDPAMLRQVVGALAIPPC